MKQAASDMFLGEVCSLTPDYMLCPRSEFFSIKTFSYLTGKGSERLEKIHWVQLRKTVFLINQRSGLPDRTGRKKISWSEIS